MFPTILEDKDITVKSDSKRTISSIRLELVEIEERLGDIEGEIANLEDERWDLEREKDKLNKLLSENPDAEKQIAEEEEAEAQARKIHYLLEKRYGDKFKGGSNAYIANYWQQ